MSKHKSSSKKAKEKAPFPLRGKLFKNGRSQAIRLPKEFRFEGLEVGIGRVGNSVILYPLNDPWALFFEGAKELSKSDLPELAREQEQSPRSFEK